MVNKVIAERKKDGKLALEIIEELLSLDLPPGPVAAEIDRDQFQGVLVNLVQNALDAMPGGGAIEVGLRREPPDRLRLTVADTGPGIDPAVADRLFTPFFSTKPTGTGLGLSLSRRVVAAHGGTLTASDHPGGGAVFAITIPTDTANGPASAGRAAEPSAR